MIQEHYYHSFIITFNLQWLKDLATATEDVAITASEIRSAVANQLPRQRINLGYDKLPRSAASSAEQNWLSVDLVHRQLSNTSIYIDD